MGVRRVTASMKHGRGQEALAARDALEKLLRGSSMGSSNQLVQREKRRAFPVEGLACAKALDLFKQKGLH